MVDKKNNEKKKDIQPATFKYGYQKEFKLFNSIKLNIKNNKKKK